MEDSKALIHTLNRVPMFQNLDQRQLKFLAKQFTERSYAADEAIVTQGEVGTGFYVLVTGHARAVRELPRDKLMVNTFDPGDFFGELALLDEGLRTASVIATEPTRCLLLTRWDFLAVLKEDVETTIKVLQAVVRRFRSMLDAI
jgi:CRP/FNR family transcriptional regulator, cyclic AMP receptor protein